MSSALPTRSSSCRGPASMQPHARTLAAILHADRASDSGASSSHVPEYSAQCCSPPGAPSRTGAARQRWQTAALQVRSAAAVKEAGLAIAGGRVKGQLSVMQSQTDAARKVSQLEAQLPGCHGQFGDESLFIWPLVCHGCERLSPWLRLGHCWQTAPFSSPQMKADWWVDVADSGLREKETAQATMKGSDAPSAQSGTSVTQEPPESDPEDINVPGMVFKSKVARASRTPSSRGVNYTAMATLSNRVQSLLDRSTHGGPASVRLAKLANGRC